MCSLEAGNSRAKDAEKLRRVLEDGKEQMMQLPVRIWAGWSWLILLNPSFKKLSQKHHEIATAYCWVGVA